MDEMDLLCAKVLEDTEDAEFMYHEYPRVVRCIIHTFVNELKQKHAEGEGSKLLEYAQEIESKHLFPQTHTSKIVNFHKDDLC